MTGRLERTATMKKVHVTAEGYEEAMAAFRKTHGHVYNATREEREVVRRMIMSQSEKERWYALKARERGIQPPPCNTGVTLDFHAILRRGK